MTRVAAPCPGRVLPLTEVPDPVFSSAMVGPGIALEPAPEETTVGAPVTGRIIKVHPHAFVIQGEDGVGILVHLGINTVRLEGKGFEVLAQQGDHVTQGDPMVRWTPGNISGEGISTIIPVVALDQPADSVTPTEASEVSPGDALFDVAG
ncbi:PTS glucose transporter subunit IIA [Nesterenkonia sp. HG001]|uniref:PTS sugar transporter subunit IIA n=1 Tax=Nesterenkonia sp. HG001 TaxID=2983207 RepID=UPI002AC584B1|nr:PTS glucose transporter subunit IIA [Nesterenkonia sp. HG001]MDZ5078130.1 PTS glucose transporter subunit IIA [Nesterenkonia sp. HG001]